MEFPVVLKMDFNKQLYSQSDLFHKSHDQPGAAPTPNSSGGDQSDEDMELIGQVASIDQTVNLHHPERNERPLFHYRHR